MNYFYKENTFFITLDRQWNDKTVNDFLDYCRQSRKNQYLLFQNKLILLNDQEVTNQTVLQENDTISIQIPETAIDWPMADQPCSVIYEDDFIYTAHKEPGMIIHTSPKSKECLNGQAAKYQEIHAIHAPVRPIHRLDKDTTGLVLYCKIPFFQPFLDDQLEEKKIQRIYYAIVKAPVPAGKKYSFCDPIGKDRHISNKYRVSNTGKNAWTEAECIETKHGYSLLKCTLHTGRTHQIRVHLSYHHLPIVNDPIYGVPSDLFQNMGLWAKELVYTDPLNNQKHSISDRINKDYVYFGKNWYCNE